MFDPPKLPRIKGSMHPRFDEILTPEALAFIAKLDGAHSGRRAELLQARRERGKRISAGERVDFLDSTAKIRTDTGWQVAPPAPGLVDRRCEITGPPTPKMTINALNSGAKVWMADFEDATAPSWSNIIGGQINLYDAIRGQLEFTLRGRQGVQGRRRDPDDRRPAPRLAAVREAPRASTAARCRRHWSTSGCSSSTTRRS